MQILLEILKKFAFVGTGALIGTALGTFNREIINKKDYNGPIDLNMVHYLDKIKKEVQ